MQTIKNNIKETNKLEVAQNEVNDFEAKKKLRDSLVKTADAVHKSQCLSVKALLAFCEYGHNPKVLDLMVYDKETDRFVDLLEIEKVSSKAIMYAVKNNMVKFFNGQQIGTTDSPYKNVNADFNHFFESGLGKTLKKESLIETFKNILKVFIWARKNGVLADKHGNPTPTVHILGKEGNGNKFFITNREGIDKHYSEKDAGVLVVTFTKALGLANKAVMDSTSGQAIDPFIKATTIIADTLVEDKDAKFGTKQVQAFKEMIEVIANDLRFSPIIKQAITEADKLEREGELAQSKK